ncbi:scopoletin glucosyltransferase-like [Argentina anserina]|uniref:scopoletin glucosyltransferase-like n=1 Tax=Argentina anserina TaxID=57926 RepID=UPI0021768E71|nr:scopoletin glucosyltransferase-like [Potentilla anserina]
MGSESHDSVHIFLFPFLAHGHMIPVSDMAKLFASHGVRVTIVTTPLNATRFTQSTQSRKSSSGLIQIKAIELPSEEAGLPKGCENMDTLPPSSDLGNSLFQATRLLQPQLEELLEEFKPTCLVADMLFPWATEAAAKFGIPRLVFHGTCFFSLCAIEIMKLHEPFKNVSSEFESFVIPYLPGEIEMTSSQVPAVTKTIVSSDLNQLMKDAIESVLKSYGVIVNSFYELEPVYADYYRNKLGRKAWHIGPVSLCNREIEEKSNRGKEATVDEHECLKWLDSKKQDSVVYVCFGSVANFNSTQLKEIAMALEAAGQDFIWVVRRGKDEGIEVDQDEWLPEGFEERMEGKGLIIRGWAPQVLILDHPSIGGFVTHCGWNSTMEGISAGLPMVTWPVSAEQFYNEKLVTKVLKIGVSVGTQKWIRIFGDSVKKETIVKAVSEIMVGEEAEMRRSKARELGKQARRSVEEGGSSYQDLNKLIQELKSQQLG